MLFRSRFKEAEAGDPTGATARSWLTRVDQLKQAVQNMPDKKIPELQLLTERNWLDAVKDAKPLQTEADVRQALNNLRDSAKMTFGEIAKDALAKYAEANGGQLPGQWSQLKPYFETPVDDAVLQRWQLLKTGNLGQAQNDNLFAETAPPVDPQYDSFYEFSMNGLTSYDLSKPSNVVELATAQFAEAHNGLLPNDASQLTPYLKRPMAPADIHTVLNQIPAGTKTLHELNAVGGR